MNEDSQLWRKEDTLALLDRLRDAMHLRRVRAAGLSRLIGVREATVSQWFTLGRLPDTEVLLAVMRVLGGDGNWWLGTGGEAPPRETLPVPPREKVTQTKRAAAAVKSARKGTPKKQAGRKGG